MHPSSGAFPRAFWSAWNSDATFLPGDELPPSSENRLYAVIVFVFYGDKIVLADIEGRGYCVPSGRIEVNETISEAVHREVFEEAGVRLKDDAPRLVGCYELVSRKESGARGTRYCPVFVVEALGFEAIPPGSESRGILLAAIEDVADLYFHWDPLMDAVFSYADAVRKSAFKPGVSLSEFTGQ
jgi:8-oxo-dGTP diphosphatase